jgi:hypothetical protein
MILPSLQDEDWIVRDENTTLKETNLPFCENRLIPKMIAISS